MCLWETESTVDEMGLRSVVHSVREGSDMDTSGLGRYGRPMTHYTTESSVR